jgi:hypothetical protein
MPVWGVVGGAVLGVLVGAGVWLVPRYAATIEEAFSDRKNQE